MKLSNKQQKALKLVEYFIPSNVMDWNSKTCKISSYQIVGVDKDTQNDSKGITAEEAFFLRSERGIISKKVKDVSRFVALLWGQRRMALEISNWKEAFEKHYLYPTDFLNEPIEIQEIAKECCLAVGREWREE